MLSLDPLGLDGAMLDEARAFLRIDPVEEDPSLAAAIRAAVVHAEHFTRTVLIRRPARETICASSGWHRLCVAPVVAVTGVTGLSLEGSRAVLPPDAWQTKLGSLTWRGRHLAIRALVTDPREPAQMVLTCEELR